MGTFLSSENSKKSESVIKKSWFSFISNGNDKGTKIDKLIWKKISKLDQSGMKTFAELTIQETDIAKAREEVLNETLKIQSKLIHFKNEFNKLKSERNENLKRMEEMVKDKNALEDKFYSEFIPILTAKKKYIQQLKDGEEESPEEEHEMEQEKPKQRVHSLSSSDNDDQDGDDTLQKKEIDEEMIQSKNDSIQSIKNESQDNNVMD